MNNNNSILNLEDIFNMSSVGLSPELIQYYKCLQDRKIILNSEITSHTLELVTIPLREMNEDGTNKPIELILNTTGGSIYDGFALVDVIEKISTPLVIRIMGLVVSMGAFIAMTHTNNPNVETVCSKYSAGLIHSTIMNIGLGPTYEAKDYMEFSNVYEEIIKNYVVSHTKITNERYDEIHRKQLWMNAEQMLELGVVSKIE